MLDHTADVDFELEAPSLEGLFDEARRALLLIMFERPPDSAADEGSVRLSAPGLQTLLVRWINELVFSCKTRRSSRPARISIREGSERGPSLEAHLVGAMLDVEAYGWKCEIKSATFHGLDVIRGGRGWQARVILDV